MLAATYTTKDGGGGLGAVRLIIYLAFIVFLVAAMWMVFTKAGEAGWKSIIPIYSTIILLKIIGRP